MEFLDTFCWKSQYKISLKSNQREPILYMRAAITELTEAFRSSASPPNDDHNETRSDMVRLADTQGQTCG